MKLSRAERMRAVAVLYEWAAAYEKDEDAAIELRDFEACLDARRAVSPWAVDWLGTHLVCVGGKELATACCFAAAMVAAGEEV